MKNISSFDNPTIRKVIALHNSKTRHQQRLFIAEGSRIIATIIASGLRPRWLFTTEEMAPEAKKLATLEEIVLISKAIMQKISTASTPSGLLAVFPIPEEESPDALMPGLVLTEIADPGNLGTLIRTAAAMNIKSIVTVEGVDPYNPKVVQASAGYLTHVSLFDWGWQELMERKGKFKLSALVVSGGKDVKSIKASDALIVVGSEAHGIPAPMLAECDQQITIAMPGKIESLNAAIAGSIAMYEVFSK